MFLSDHGNAREIYAIYTISTIYSYSINIFKSKKEQLEKSFFSES